MIHNKQGEPVTPYTEEQPFYLLCDGKPLPVAVKEGNPEARAWRNTWEKYTSEYLKWWNLYHPTLRVWVSGFTDGKEAVEQAAKAWDSNKLFS